MRQSVESVLQDLRYAFRTLRKRRAFTAISILTLGLGVGGTTAIFSVVDGVLIRDLPYRDPDGLVSVWKAWPGWRGVEGVDYTWDHIQFPWVDYQNVKDHASTLSEVAAFSNTDLVLSEQGEPEPLSVGRASANLFDLLGVRPVLGRAFTDEELPEIAGDDGARVVILSHELWSRQFGGDPEILGRSIQLSGTPHAVVGVLPAGFRIGSDLIRTHQNGGDVDAGLRDLWVPLRLNRGHSNSYELLARLAPGVSAEQTRAEVQTLMTLGPENQVARVEPRKGVVTKGFGTPLLLLLGGAGILLVVACVNVAGLLVGEATGRHHEVTVRYALGASRWRVLRQLLTENVLLGLMGSALGVALAFWGTEALLSVAPPLPRLEEVTLSGRVFFFAGAAGVTTGLLFGLAPATALAGRSVGKALSSRGQSAGRGGRSLQAGVVSVQVALTVVLLVAGGLFGRSLLSLLAVDPGFNAGSLMSVPVTLPDENVSTAEETESRSSRRERIFREVVTATQNVAGVVAVSGTDYVPFGGGHGTWGVELEIQGQRVGAIHYVRHVLPDYHELMGIPLVHGRLFSRADGPDDPRVMLVSEGLAELYWPSESPVGASARYEGETLTIVGVVGNVKKKALGSAAEPTFYFSASQIPQASLALVVKTIGDPATVVPRLREAIRSVDPSILIAAPTTLSALEKDSESDDRFRAILMLTFAALATLLAAVGIFGVTARGVAARRREMGIRMALGARHNGLVGLVLRDSMISAVAGAGVGMAGALWAVNLIEHFLFGVTSRDPLTFVGVIAVLLLACLAAAYIPAKRITKITPMEVITSD
jgi:predicted permease